MLAAARAYVDHYEMSVIPLRVNDKRPAIGSWKMYQQRRPRPDELAEWFKGRANIGVVTGRISGIIVIDIDGPEGEASLAQLEVPATVEVRTPKGRHLYFRHPGRDVRNGARIMPGVDVRGDGGYVVAPPSVVNGTPYAFVATLKNTEMAELPAWFWRLNPERPVATAPLDEDFTVGEGSRNDRLISEAGSLRRRGWSVEDIAEALLVWNTRHCRPPLPDREVRAIARSAGRWDPEVRLEATKKPVVPDPSEFRYEDWDAFQRKIDYHSEQSIRMDTIDMRPVEWLWPGFIPRGMVTIITGEEGLGKSQLALKIAAEFSTGDGEFTSAPWAMKNPQDDMPGGLVKLYSAEDPLHQVLAPRMKANGANLAHVFTEGINVQTFLPDGIHDIARGIDEMAFGMVIIDPILAYIGAESDANSMQDVRAIMRMLADLADVSNTIIIGVMHPKKGEESQMLHKMIGGSSAFGQAARSVLGVARHPEEDDWRVVGRIKGNLDRRPTPMAYEIRSRTFTLSADTKISTSQVEFRGEVDDDFDFDAALQGRKKKKKGEGTPVADRRPIDEAIIFLRAELVADSELRVKDVLKLARDVGISRSTLYRAKDELGIRTLRKEDGWRWSLPEGPTG